jgi:formylglycine-generating enzyme required for sulfatase activity
MVYDSRRSRAVLFGGFVPSTGFANDTWEWDGVSWQQRTMAVAPSVRGYFGMAYDSIRGRAVVFGGTDNSQASLAETWEFDGQNWAQSAASGPGGRRGPAMTFDDTRGNVVLFGGGDGAQTFGDTWTYDGAAWTQRTTANAPSPRWQAQMEHDTLCGRAVLHSGADAAYANNYGDSWAWDGTAWTQLPGSSPPGRHGAAVAFDAQRGQTVLWGGRDVNGFYADTWQLSSPCSRTMSVVTPPQVGNTASFRFDYPLAAAGHFYFHLLTANQQVPYAVPIPGMSSIGLSRVDLFSMYLQETGVLDSSGSSLFNVGIPADNLLAGLPFDVQSLDLNFATNSVHWASNDAEVSISVAIPPVASFAATPAFGQAPLVVQFTDTSTNGPTSWQWDFNNDGIVDSSQQSPTYTYAAAGLYSVRLVASNLGGSSFSLRHNLIYAGPVVPNPLLNMVPIAPGAFHMGSVYLGGNSVPVHSVAITRPFWMCKYEVTQAEYLALVGSNPSAGQGSGYPNPSPQRPVERVTWGDAMAYCALLTTNEASAGRIPAGYQYRLPTEAEWEYCCRAGTTTEWNTGSALTTAQANFAGNPYFPIETFIVGVYAANPWGLFDMHGNVFEWCLDSWDGTANYPSAAVSDPYVAIGSFRIARGGSYNLTPYQCMSANRGFNLLPGVSIGSIGFRIVLAPILVP